jgi:hypothetical protein
MMKNKVVVILVALLCVVFITLASCGSGGVKANDVREVWVDMRYAGFVEVRYDGHDYLLTYNARHLMHKVNCICKEGEAQ